MNRTFDTCRKTRAIIGMVTLFSIVSARAADLVTTLHFNPSLSREANPFCSILGFDATQLIASNLFGIVVFLLVPLFVYVVRSPAKMEEKADSLTEYVSLQLFRSKLPRSRILSGVFLGWPLPKNWLQAIRLLGFALSWAIVFGSIQATFGWWATNHWGMDWYRQYRGIANFRGYPVIELIPVMLVFYGMGYLFFRMEFKGNFAQPPETEQ